MHRATRGWTNLRGSARSQTAGGGEDLCNCATDRQPCAGQSSCARTGPDSRLDLSRFGLVTPNTWASSAPVDKYYVRIDNYYVPGGGHKSCHVRPQETTTYSPFGHNCCQIWDTKPGQRASFGHKTWQPVRVMPLYFLTLAAGMGGALLSIQHRHGMGINWRKLRLAVPDPQLVATASSDLAPDSSNGAGGRTAEPLSDSSRSHQSPSGSPRVSVAHVPACIESLR